MSEVAQRTSADVSDQLRAAIAATDTAFMEAFNRGDAAGAARAAYTREAEIQPPGAPMIEGRDNIAEFWGEGQRQLGIRSCELKTLKLRQAGPYVHQLGAATLTFADGSQAAVKYAVLWKEEDGRMKWHVDTWNMDG
jgi:ketosteroid isomerase-like protein